MGNSAGTFTQSDLQALVRANGGPCISIYLPLVTAGPQIQQNTLRLRNLLDSAQQKLLACGKRNDEAAVLLAPLRALQDNDEFWRHLAPGLALFAAPAFHSIHMLPLEMPERSCCGEHFDIVPLLPLVFNGGYFHLLAVNLHGAQLFSANRQHITALPLPDAPEQVEDYRMEGEPVGASFHSGTGRGGRTAMFYGYGQQDENRERAVEKFLDDLADAVDRKLADSRYPLLIAAEAAQAGELRPKLRYPHLLPGFLEGNPRLQEPEQLLAAALPLVEPLLEGERAAARQEIEARQGRDGAAVADGLKRVLSSASSGAVDALFIREGYIARGSFNAEDGSLVEAADGAESSGEDLVNLAALLTVRNGGRVWLQPRESMPGGQDIAAALRF